MKKKIVFGVLFVMLIGVGVAGYQTGMLPQLIASLKQRFGPQAENGKIVVSGNVEVTEVNVGFTLAGRIQELLADEGQEVKQDDPLAVLENAQLKAGVDQNKAALAIAAAQFEDLKSGSRTQDIGQAKANLNSATAQRDKAKKDFQRAEALYKQKLVPASQLDAARSLYEAAAAQQNALVERLSLVKEGATKDALLAAEHRVAQAQAALQIAEEQLKNARIAAPMAGVILKKNAERGEIIAQGTPVYTIGDLENPWIKVYVKEDKLGQVKLGQPAQVTIDSFPGKIYAGTVTYISAEAEFTPKTVQTQEERVKLVFGVKVRVKNPDGELKPGMPADVKILLK